MARTRGREADDDGFAGMTGRLMHDCANCHAAIMVVIDRIRRPTSASLLQNALLPG
jgi:hypothetical protein